MKFGDPEYYVRRISRREFEVAVFRGGKAPDQIYTVQGSRCSCPAGGGDDHKHVRLVVMFQAMGEPSGVVFFNEPLGWESHYVYD